MGQDKQQNPLQFQTKMIPNRVCNQAQQRSNNGLPFLSCIYKRAKKSQLYKTVMKMPLLLRLRIAETGNESPQR